MAIVSNYNNCALKLTYSVRTAMYRANNAIGKLLLSFAIKIITIP
jgi:hypothetical protein